MPRRSDTYRRKAKARRLREIARKTRIHHAKRRGETKVEYAD